MDRELEGEGCAAGSEAQPANADLNPEQEQELARSRQTRLIERARNRLLGALPDMATALAAKAKAGSAPHMRLLLQILDLYDGGLAEQQVQVKEKTLEEILMEQWNREPSAAISSGTNGRYAWDLKRVGAGCVPERWPGAGVGER